MLPNEQTANVTVDPTGTIIADIACRRCGYNLRGLNHQSRCPECNTAVGLSTQGDLLRFADPTWLETLARGCSFILWGLAATIAAAFLMVCATFAGLQAIGQIVLFLTSLLAVYGSWLLTSPDPGGIDETRYTNARRTVRVALIIGLFYGFLNLPLQSLPLPQFAFMILLFLSIAAGLVGTVGEVAKYFYLSTLSDRIPNPTFAGRARLIAWAFAIGLPVMYTGMALTAVVAMSQMKAAGGPYSFTAMQQGMNPGGFSVTTTGTPPSGSNAIFMAIGGCFTAISGIALFVFYILALILIYKLGQAFREQAHYARAISALHLNPGSPIEERPIGGADAT